MTIMKNEGSMDRGIRAIVGEVLFLGGFFWLGGTGQIVAYVLSAATFFTVISGFCSFYRIFGINTCAVGRPVPGYLRAVFVVAFLVIAVGGAYASIFFSTKFFLEDYNRMNAPYKQTLFETGQGKREESKANYAALTRSYADFSGKYFSYHPYALRGDAAFGTDLARVSSIIGGLATTVDSGDLHEAHLALEGVRPIFQDILKRNGFSLLAVSLVDFHDAMEEVLAPAEAKDAVGTLAAHKDADLKLRAVEAEADDAEIRAIRKNLDDLKALAEAGTTDMLPAKAAELKSSFVKVYLKRG